MNKTYLETIKILNGEAQHLEWHQLRMDTVLQNPMYRLQELISAPKNGLYRCRVLYSKKEISFEYIRYKKRNVHSIKLVYDDTIEYSKKFANRESLDLLFAKRETCDDVLIVKNSLVRDTTIANVAFFDGEKWLTPEEPLLKGTTRERLLKEKKIFTKEIRVQDLDTFTKIALMNAMVNFDIIAKNIEEVIC